MIQNQLLKTEAFPIILTLQNAGYSINTLLIKDWAKFEVQKTRSKKYQKTPIQGIDTYEYIIFYGKYKVNNRYEILLQYKHTAKQGKYTLIVYENDENIYRKSVDGIEQVVELTQYMSKRLLIKSQ